jgi:hypothetical protein
MAIKTLKVKVTTPVEKIPFGRGFYQLEEEALYLPLIHSTGFKARFYSYLDSEFVSFYLDRDGRLIFIEITLPRRRWKVKENLVAPDLSRPADIRFLDFRDSFENPAIFCDLCRQNLMIRLKRFPAISNFRLAENLIAQVGSDNRLTAVWVSDIIDDLAGREISAWRKSIFGTKPPHLSDAHRVVNM